MFIASHSWRGLPQDLLAGTGADAAEVVAEAVPGIAHLECLQRRRLLQVEVHSELVRASLVATALLPSPFVLPAEAIMAGTRDPA